MTTRSWSPTTADRHWETLANWTPDGPPGLADSVAFTAGMWAIVTSDQVMGFLALSGPGATLDIGGGTFTALDGLTLSTAATLTVDGTLANTPVTLGGGTLLGRGTLLDDKLIGTLSLSMPGQFMQIGGTVTLAAPAGQIGADLSGFGSGLIAAAADATLDGGIVRLASAVASNPSQLGENAGGQLTLGAGLTVDVTGYGRLDTPFSGAPALVNQGKIVVASGGTLAIQGRFASMGSIDVAGTLDFSGTLSPAVANPITMDGAGATLILAKGQQASISGLAPGQTVDFTSVTPVANMVGQVSGNQLQIADPDGTVAASITLAGAALPGMIYQVASDGRQAQGLPQGITVTPVPGVGVADQTTKTAATKPLTPIGPNSPSYLQWKYADSSADTVSMTSRVPGVFLKGGTGTKAMAATSGQNVLDGGFGSSFLSGGSGSDTFFVDLRGSNTVWDTITNFHAGDAVHPADAVTVWGWAPNLGTETIDPFAGAAGYQGATLRLSNSGGGPVSSVTFAGLSAEQVQQFSRSSGTAANGLPYLYIEAR